MPRMPKMPPKSQIKRMKAQEAKEPRSHERTESPAYQRMERKLGIEKHKYGKRS